MPLEDRCPRCGQGFHCGARDAGPCACTSVKLEPETLRALQGRYSSCLCLRCLLELAAEAKTSA